MNGSNKKEDEVAIDSVSIIANAHSITQEDFEQIDFNSSVVTKVEQNDNIVFEPPMEILTDIKDCTISNLQSFNAEQSVISQQDLNFEGFEKWDNDSASVFKQQSCSAETISKPMGTNNENNINVNVIHDYLSQLKQQGQIAVPVQLKIAEPFVTRQSARESGHCKEWQMMFDSESTHSVSFQTESNFISSENYSKDSTSAFYPGQATAQKINAMELSKCPSIVEESLLSFPDTPTIESGAQSATTLVLNSSSLPIPVPSATTATSVLPSSTTMDMLSSFERLLISSTSAYIQEPFTLYLSPNFLPKAFLILNKPIEIPPSSSIPKPTQNKPAR